MGSGKVTVVALLLCLSVGVIAEDPYLYFNWNVTYGTVSPLGVPQQGILINGQFPGPRINCTSNNNIVVNVFNNLDEPFLFTWNGVQHRKNSWQDGTPGTMCPIMPGQNFTYRFQVKDQIGSYYYFPTTALHRAAGGYGAINVHSRALIPVPFDNPADEYNVFVGDWYNKGHKTLKKVLDGGHTVGRPDGIIINGKSAKVGEAKEPLFTMEAGKTYRYRFCNLGMRSSVNVRFQGHPMKLVELEGSHTVQNIYDSLDIHVGQCLSVLVTANQEPKDYYLVVSSRFLKQELSSVAIIRYANGKGPASPELPASPPDNTEGIAWSMNQFRSFRWNLTASAARPNPQGSYHYGQINITRTIKIVNSMGQVNGKLRYGLNGISHSDTETPLKLVEYFGAADKSFKYDLMADEAPADPSKLTVAPNVKNTTYRNFVEIIFENHEKSIRTYHLDGYSFFAVAVAPAPEKIKWDNLDLLNKIGLQSRKDADASYVESGLATPKRENVNGSASTESPILNNIQSSLPDIKKVTQDLLRQTDTILGALMVLNATVSQFNKGAGLFGKGDAKEDSSTGLENDILLYPMNKDGIVLDEKKAEEMKSLFSTAETAMEAWALLATSLGHPTFIKSEFDKLCFLDNESTDTEVALWRDSARKRLVVAFRGTEQTKWKDLVTDLMLVPAGLNPERIGGDFKEEVQVHSGFLSAYDSVRIRLISLIKKAIGYQDDDLDTPNKWHVYVTGHSLGGALATLLALELSSSQLAKRGAIRVTMYNFGSPRVGNKKFAEVYNEKVKDSWRVVNHRDIIPTVPRLMGYCHVAQPVYLAAGDPQNTMDNVELLEDGYQGDVIGEATPDVIVSEFMKGEKELIEKILNTEINIFLAIRDGSALMQHMEDFYYITLLENVRSNYRTVPRPQLTEEKNISIG